MMKKIIIVGLNPAKDNWKSPKKAQTIQRLEKWCNLMGVQYHSFINCIDDAGDYNQLKANFKQLEECTQGYDKVIALGNYASMCLKKINVKQFPCSRLINGDRTQKRELLVRGVVMVGL